MDCEHSTNLSKTTNKMEVPVSENREVEIGDVEACNDERDKVVTPADLEVGEPDESKIEEGHPTYEIGQPEREYADVEYMEPVVGTVAENHEKFGAIVGEPLEDLQNYTQEAKEDSLAKCPDVADEMDGSENDVGNVEDNDGKTKGALVDEVPNTCISPTQAVEDNAAECSQDPDKVNSSQNDSGGTQSAMAKNVPDTHISHIPAEEDNQAACSKAPDKVDSLENDGGTFKTNEGDTGCAPVEDVTVSTKPEDTNNIKGKNVKQQRGAPSKPPLNEVKSPEKSINNNAGRDGGGDGRSRASREKTQHHNLTIPPGKKSKLQVPKKHDNNAGRDGGGAGHSRASRDPVSQRHTQSLPPEVDSPNKHDNDAGLDGGGAGRSRASRNPVTQRHTRSFPPVQSNFTEADSPNKHDNDAGLDGGATGRIRASRVKNKYHTWTFPLKEKSKDKNKRNPEGNTPNNHNNDADCASIYGFGGKKSVLLLLTLMLLHPAAGAANNTSSDSYGCCSFETMDSKTAFQECNFSIQRGAENICIFKPNEPFSCTEGSHCFFYSKQIVKFCSKGNNVEELILIHGVNKTTIHASNPEKLSSEEVEVLSITIYYNPQSPALNPLTTMTKRHNFGVLVAVAAILLPLLLGLCVLWCIRHRGHRDTFNSLNSDTTV